MLEVRENVLFLNSHLSPPRMVEPLELVGDERTDDAILIVIIVVQHEDLSVLKVLESISGNEDDPVVISTGSLHNTSDGLSVGVPDGVGVGRYSSQLLVGFLGRKAEGFLITTDHLDPSFLENQRPQFDSLDNPQEKEIIILGGHLIIDNNIMFLPITPKSGAVGSKGISFLILNHSS